jgi:hypothetical protein
MPTNRNRRTRKSTKPVIPKALIYFFQTGSTDQSAFDESERYNPFLTWAPRRDGKDAPDLWMLCRDKVISGWIKKHPCTRPHGFWKYDKSEEPRRQFETEAGYLRKHGLLTTVEEAHLKKRPELLVGEVSCEPATDSEQRGAECASGLS